jgi:hypothetical protein
MEQNFKNHSRLVPLHHFVVPVILLGLLVAAIVDLYEKIRDDSNIVLPLFLLLLTVALMLIWFHSRAFALKAQDRVIMLEEKLRHQQLTGKALNANLRPSQIIALRFAGDAEFPALAEKAAAENMDGKSIKQSIQNWKGDNYRV